MSPAHRFARTITLARRLVVGCAAGSLGLLLACVPAKTDTETPDGPSESSEAPAAAVIEAGMAEGADEAAKQAAAQAVLKKVKDRDPEEEKKKMARSKAVSAEARGKLKRGNQAEALQTARDALKIHEQNVDAMLVIAEAYYKQGKYELVHAVTTSALQVDAKIRTPEESSRAYNLQGFAMLGLGEDTLAQQAFKKAAEVDEKNPTAWNNLGTRYLQAGDVATAASCFQYALELDPRFPQAQLNYGAALRAQSKWEEAEVAMRKALELRPNYAEAYFNLGVLYLDADPFPGLDTTQRLNKAIQSLGKYRELAIADSGARPGKKGIGLGGDGKAPPPPVSKERADDYIRVAKKGLEREERRLEREKAKPAGGEPAAGGDAPAGGEPAAGGDAPPAGPDDGAPEQPTPQGPGIEPSKPAPQGPGIEPSKPAPQGPGIEPSKPAPQGPGTEPSKPAPQGPTTPAPTPVEPAPTPVKPAPQGPTTPAPTPVKPAPQGPTPTPVKPAPPPSVQKPQSAAALVEPPSSSRLVENLASRGTRSVPSTLNPMAGRAVVPRVPLAALRPTLLIHTAQPPVHGVDAAADHGCRSFADLHAPMPVDPRRSLV